MAKRKNQRALIDQKLRRFAKLSEPLPLSGWLQAIRGSLGLTTRQLAALVGVSHTSIVQLEKREPALKVTLESLQKVAQAMDCKIVYAIVPNNPNESLEDILNRRATAAASLVLKEVSHSMRLEAQGTSEKERNFLLRETAAKLKDSNDPRLWRSPLQKASAKRPK